MLKKIWILLLLSIFLPLQAIDPLDVPITKCPHNRIDKRRGVISLCAIFRDEARYLKEWIEFHRLIGVSHFYLYNNCSQDNYLEVLKPYVDQGIIELFEVPVDTYQRPESVKAHNFVQVCCYNHAIQLAKGFNTWIAIIDTDEFICPVVDPNLLVTMKRYEQAQGLVVYWQIYGTSNVWDLQPGELMIEKLLHREPNQGGNGLFKSIVRPQFACCVDPHYCTTKGKSVLPNGKKFTHFPNFSVLPTEIIRINHYTHRTESYYQTIKKPRRKIWGEDRSPEVDKQLNDFFNSVYDPVMLRFTAKLRERMK